MIALLCAVAQGSWASNYGDEWWTNWDIEHYDRTGWSVWDGHSAEKPKFGALCKNSLGQEGVVVISTAAELAWVMQNYSLYSRWDYLVAGIQCHQDATNARFMLIKDIDMTAGTWLPLGFGKSDKFRGTFDGNGHTIRIKMDSSTSENYQGMFDVNNGVVYNLHLDASIKVGNARFVGGICGENNGTIKNCWVSGHIESNHYSQYDADLGGVAGINEDNGKIQYCCVMADVKNTAKNSGVGGIAGSNEGTIQHVTFTGTVSVEHSQDNKYVGDQDKTLENYYDSYNEGEFNTASSNNMYRRAIKYPYAINVKTEGHGAHQVSIGGDHDVPGCYAGGTVTLTKTSGTAVRIDIKDADGNWVYSSGDINGTLTFTMPKRDVNITAYYYEDWPTQGAGTEGDPYIISSAEDWNKFAHNVNNGRTYSGNHIKLANNISVTNPVGSTVDNSFQGNFDGDGHTLTFNRSDWTEIYSAPFRYVGNASFRNLHVAGTISTTYQYAGGVVAWIVNGSTVSIENCRSSMTLNSSHHTNGGFVSRLGDNATLTISGCVFDGSFEGTGRANGGFVGYCQGGSSATFTYCLFKPDHISCDLTSCQTFSRGVDATITGCYYTQTLGMAQGTPCVPAASIPDNLGSPTAEYGIVTAYQNGLLFDGRFYTPYTPIILANTGNNTANITGNNGYLAKVTFADRTIYKDGNWSTLCLPFDVQLNNSPLAGATARPLKEGSINGSTLDLTFGDAVTTLQAGTPYIIKWPAVASFTYTCINGWGRWGDGGFNCLVDGDTATKYCKQYGPWMCYFKTSVPVGVTGYTLTTGDDTQTYPDRNPMNWTLEAKLNEGDAWTTIDSRDVWSNSDDALPAANTTESKVYTIKGDRVVAYQYFRFIVNSTHGQWMQLSELTLKQGSDLVNPVFDGVIIDAADRSYDNGAADDQRVRFLGTYQSTSFDAEDKSILLLSSEKTLNYPTNGTVIGAQGAYFKLGSEAAIAQLASYNIDFGDGESAKGVLSLSPLAGDGSEGNPFIISNAAEWFTFAYNVNSGTETCNGKFVKLTNDISVTEKCGMVSGSTQQNAFSGTFDGDGHTITVTISDNSNQGAALFSYINGATIKNLNVAGTISSNQKHAAALVGFSKGTCSIENCTVAANVNGNEYVGGIVGHALDSNISINNCIFSGLMTGGSNFTGVFIGWGDSGTRSVANCLYIKPEGQNTSNFDMVKAGGTLTMNNCYKTTSAGSCGTQVYTAVPDNEIGALITAADNKTYYILCKVSGISNYQYTGEAITVKPTVTINGTTLTEGTDYTYTTSPETVKERGDYTLIITAQGDTYTGTKTVYFTVSESIEVTSTSTTLSSGAYTVCEDVTIDTRINISGNVVLNLGEGTTLHAKKGIELGEGNTLTINGSGTLTIDNCDYGKSGIGAEKWGALVINGGTINAKGGFFGTGLGGDAITDSHVIEVRCGSITINGGVINAKGDYSAGIGGNVVATTGTVDIKGCDIVINGGQITASGGGHYPGISPCGVGLTDNAVNGTLTLGWTNPDDFISTDSYDAQSIFKGGTFASITFAEGKQFIIEGTGTIATAENFSGKKIVPAVVLADNADNSEVLSTYDRKQLPVVLADRTLYKDGKWNTLCLPFNVTLAGSALEGATARPLESAIISGTTLNLAFGNAVTELKAGTPYIIKWDGGDNIENPVFSAATIDATDRSYDNGASGDQRVRFLGTYKSTAFDAVDKSILLMGGASMLYTPAAGASIGAQRAYFKLGDGEALARRITSYNIDFGEGDMTGVIEVKEVREVKDDSWYTLDGRKLDGKPSRAGVYINNGNKVVVK